MFMKKFFFLVFWSILNPFQSFCMDPLCQNKIPFIDWKVLTKIQNAYEYL